MKHHQSLSLLADPSLDSHATVLLKMEDIRIGSTVLIKLSTPISEASPTILKYWVPGMNNTLGRLGIVKAVDHKKNLVEVYFYDSENGILQEWWFPVGCVNKPSKKQGVLKAGNKTLEATDPTDLEKQAADGFNDLSHIYARRLLITLLRYSFPPLLPNPSGSRLSLVVQAWTTRTSWIFEFFRSCLFNSLISL